MKQNRRTTLLWYKMSNDINPRRKSWISNTVSGFSNISIISCGDIKTSTLLDCRNMHGDVGWLHVQTEVPKHLQYFTREKITSRNIFLASLDYNDGILKEELCSPQNSLYFSILYLYCLLSLSRSPRISIPPAFAINFCPARNVPLDSLISLRVTGWNNITSNLTWWTIALHGANLLVSSEKNNT